MKNPLQIFIIVFFCLVTLAAYFIDPRPEPGRENLKSWTYDNSVNDLYSDKVYEMYNLRDDKIVLDIAKSRDEAVATLSYGEGMMGFSDTVRNDLLLMQGVGDIAMIIHLKEDWAIVFNNDASAVVYDKNYKEEDYGLIDLHRVMPPRVE